VCYKNLVLPSANIVEWLLSCHNTIGKKIVLKIFKDFTVDYNPSSFAKVLNKTRVGTLKALISIDKDSIVKGRNLGKARFYKINLRINMQEKT
jgi:hypothetical protein